MCVTVTFRSALTSLALLLWFLPLTMPSYPQNCCSLDVFSFLHHSHKRSAVSEILKSPCLEPTIIPRSKSLRSHFIPNLTFCLNNSWPCLHAFMHLVAATWLADEIFALASRRTGLPNKFLTECTFSDHFVRCTCTPACNTDIRTINHTGSIQCIKECSQEVKRFHWCSASVRICSIWD